jgi:hypothetical protein
MSIDQNILEHTLVGGLAIAGKEWLPTVRPVLGLEMGPECRRNGPWTTPETWPRFPGAVPPSSCLQGSFTERAMPIGKLCEGRVSLSRW